MEQRKIADNQDYEAYNDRPIEGFGQHILSKSGWKENAPIGRTNKAVIKPIELTPRHHRGGLGSTPMNPLPKKDNSKQIDYIGTKVRITGGKHNGLKGKLTDHIYDLDSYFNENEYVNVELKINKQKVQIKSKYLKLKHRNKEKSKKKEISDNDKDKDKNNDNDSEDHNRKNVKGIEKSKRAQILKWVIPNIKVRIISKSKEYGKYYNTKGIIIDVPSATQFSVLTYNKTIINDLTEKEIETIIPQINETVVILNGEFKGENAKLLERDKKKNKVILQILSDLNIIELTQDDCCALNV